MLKGPDGFVQGYNTQIAVEPVFQLIVGQRVTQAANDKQQMVPLVEAIEEQSGQKPEGVLADNGYCSDENLKYLAKKRMEGFVAAGKQKHSQRREPCKRGPLPREASRVERMERKLETKVGAAVYATRKFIVEPVYGQIKQARGFRQFLLRGIEKSMRRMGSDLHDPQYSEVSQDLFWIERQFPVQSVAGSAQRSD